MKYDSETPHFLFNLLSLHFSLYRNNCIFLSKSCDSWSLNSNYNSKNWENLEFYLEIYKFSSIVRVQLPGRKVTWWNKWSRARDKREAYNWRALDLNWPEEGWYPPGLLTKSTLHINEYARLSTHQLICAATLWSHPVMGVMVRRRGISYL